MSGGCTTAPAGQIFTKTDYKSDKICCWEKAVLDNAALGRPLSFQLIFLDKSVWTSTGPRPVLVRSSNELKQPLPSRATKDIGTGTDFTLS